MSKTEYTEVGPGAKVSPSGALFIYDEEVYNGPPKNGPRGTGALPDILETYVAPPFAGGADGEEVHVEGSPEKESTILFDEKNEVVGVEIDDDESKD